MNCFKFGILALEYVILLAVGQIKIKWWLLFSFVNNFSLTAPELDCVLTIHSFTRGNYMFPFPCFLDDFPNCQYFRESVVRQNGWDHLGSFWNSPKCWAPSPPNPDLIGLVCSLGIWIFKSSQVILMCSQGWQPECPSCVTDGIFPRSVSPLSSVLSCFL